MDRLKKWKKKEEYGLFITEPMNDSFKQYFKGIKEEDKLSNDTIRLLAKELIFDIKDELPIIHVISPYLDTEKFRITYEHAFDYILEGSNEEIEKDIISILGITVGLEIPIYPNNLKVEKQLSKYYEKLLINGFTTPDNEGKEIRLKPTNSKKLSDFELNNIGNLDLTKDWLPTDLYFIRNKVREELKKLSNVQKTILSLEIAISNLEKILLKTKRNENELQTCLTSNPVLLGLEYMNILPKMKLGSEYEVDYALEQHSGLIDLMEIESSTLKLYTKQGNPTSHLVHAEQQIIDWLDWVEKNNSYIRDKQPGLISPKGFVVIGRNNTLSEKTKSSLIRRNKLFNKAITILTYDDIVQKAKTILDHLKK